MEAEPRVEAHTFEDSASSALVEELLTALGRLPDGGAGTRWTGVRSLFALFPHACRACRPRSDSTNERLADDTDCY